MPRRAASFSRTDVAEDTQLSLQAAARLAFPDGTVSARTLRAEAARGKLAIFRIGKKYYTTVAEIERMIERCPVQPKARISISGGDPGGPPSGQSGTEAARAALKASMAKLKEGSRTTSRPSTGRTSATVIQRRIPVADVLALYAQERAR
jgi:hypothetical protein